MDEIRVCELFCGVLSKKELTNLIFKEKIKWNFFLQIYKRSNSSHKSQKFQDKFRFTRNKTSENQFVKIFDVIIMHIN
jgi:hypothetical protein